MKNSKVHIYESPYYRNRIGLEDDGTCETCQTEEEDSEHTHGEMSGMESGATENLWEACLTWELIKAEHADIIAFLAGDSA